MKLLFIFLISMSLSACVSTWLDKNTARLKNTFTPEATRLSIVADVGKPYRSFDKASSKILPPYHYPNFASYDVFDVYGKIAMPTDEAPKQGSLTTLLIDEMVAVPSVLVTTTTDYLFKSSDLIVFYDKNKHYLGHKIYDKSGKLLFSSKS